MHTVGLVSAIVGVAVVGTAITDSGNLVLVVDAEGTARSRELVTIAIIRVGRGRANESALIYYLLLLSFLKRK